MIGCDTVGWVVVLLVGGCGSVGREASKELHNCTIAPSHLCQRKDNFCARVIAMCNSITQITQLHKFAKTAPYMINIPKIIIKQLPNQHLLCRIYTRATAQKIAARGGSYFYIRSWYKTLCKSLGPRARSLVNSKKNLRSAPFSKSRL